MERKDKIRPPRYNPDFVLPNKGSTYYDLLNSKQEEFIAAGPANTGKTHMTVQYGHKLACLYPKTKGVFVRKTKESVKKTIIPTYYDVLGYNPTIDQGYVKGYGGINPQLFRYSNGSEVIIMGFSDPKEFDSLQADWIYVNQAEDLEEGDWEILTARCRLDNMGFNVVYGDCNPSYPEHWLSPINDHRRESVHLYPTFHTDNPTLYRDRKYITEKGEREIAKLQRMKGVRYQRYYEGLWVFQEGAVFQSFDRQRHVSKVQWEKSDFGPEWKWYRSIDFGANNPKVCQLWAVRDRKEYRLVQEIYKTKLLPTEFYDEIITLTKKWTDKIEFTTADHDGDANLILEDCERRKKQGLHLTTVKKMNRLLPRIELQKVYYEDDKITYNKSTVLHRPDELLIEANKPINTVQEITRYSYPEKRLGTIKDEYPVDINDHGIDAQGYFIDTENDHIDLEPKGYSIPVKTKSIFNFD